MSTVTKPYSDFVNNVDVADAVKVNAQLNALYNFLNAANIDFTNLSTAAYSKLATANTLAQRDANGNVVSAFPLSNSQIPNLLFNPSARMGLNGWGVSNAGGSSWSAQFGLEAGYFLVGNVTNGVPILTSAAFTVVAGNQYTLTLDMLSSGATAGVQSADIQWLDTNNAVISSIRVNTTNGLGWTRYTVSGVSPANAVKAVIRLFGDGGFTTTSSGWRRIKIEQNSYATTFSDDNTLNTTLYGSVLGLMQSVIGGYKQETVSSVSATTPGTAGVQKMGTFTFPSAFSAPPAVLPVVNSGMGACTSVGSFNITATTFDLYGNIATINSPMTFTYIAIGT